MGPDGRGGPAAPGVPPPREAVPADPAFSASRPGFPPVPRPASRAEASAADSIAAADRDAAGSDAADPAGALEPSARPRRSARPVIVALQVTVTVAILVWVVVAWGPAPFIAATRVLTWPAVVAGLVLGALGILLQAHRWRLVASAQGLRVSTSAAVARCWQAAFLNAVLPGGLAGDAVRAVEQPSRRSDASSRSLRDTLKRSVGAVAAERLAGTTVVFLAAAVTLAPVHLTAALLCLAVAAVTAVVAWPWLRRLPRRTLGLVIVLSVAGWAVFAAIFVVALVTVAPAVPLGQAPALAAIALAGMSVPLNVAGWGPREGAAALGFILLGHPPAQGVAVSVAYGLLALVSVLPGAVVLLARTLRSGRPHAEPASRTSPGYGPTIHPVAAAPSPQARPSNHHRPRHAHRAAQEK